MNKLKSPSPKDALCQVWLKKTPWFWRRFLNVVLVFLPFCYYFPLEKSRTLHLNQNESSSPKDAFCKVWLILEAELSRKRFLNSSLRKVHDPLFPFTQGCFVPSLVEIVLMVLGKKIKMSKVIVRTEVSLNGLFCVTCI